MPEVTWYHQGREVTENKDVHIKMTDKGHCELYISEVFPEDAGEYLCKAVSCAGEAKSEALLIVECKLFSGFSYSLFRISFRYLMCVVF